MKQSRALRGRNPARDSQAEGMPLAFVAPVERQGPFCCAFDCVAVLRGVGPCGANDERVAREYRLRAGWVKPAR